MKTRLSRIGATAAALLVTTSILTACKPSQADNKQAQASNGYQQLAPDTGYQITSIQKGSYSFTPTAEQLDSGAVDSALCPGKVCTCESDIDRVQLTATDSISGKINQSLASIALPVCSATVESEKSKTQITYISPQLVSVVSDQKLISRGAADACQGQTLAMTFDRSTGNELQLRDVVDQKDLPAIARVLARDITARQNRTTPGSATEDAVADKIAGTDGSLGLFVKAGKVMVQVDDFMFGCESGHSFPAALPVQYIRNDKLRAAVGSGTNP